jgi:pimeloyl-ACP methyl ester carboxylesterase
MSQTKSRVYDRDLISSGSHGDNRDDAFVLAGHSLGGYLAGSYALKYPKSVLALVRAAR